MFGIEMSTHLVFIPVAVVILAALVPVIVRLLGGSRKESLPYEREESLFTPAERSFLGVLAQLVGDQYVIFGKIRLADILRPKRGLSQQQRSAALNRIISKHVDFALCERGTLRVAGVIELDDRSHQSERRKQRDSFLDGAMAAAGVPVLHIAAQKAYTAADIQRQISEAFKIELGVSRGAEPTKVALSGARQR